jgi:hypothetical protein
VLRVYNVWAIRQIHLNQIAAMKRVRPMSNGLKPWNCEGRVIREQRSYYRFERINLRTVRRINLTDGTETIIGPKMTFEVPERINLPVYLGRKLKDPNHEIFDYNGVMTWFAGSRPITSAVQDAAWAAVEAIGPIRESDAKYQRLPFAKRSRRSYLYLPLDADVDFPTLMAMQGGMTPKEGVVHRACDYGCEYETLAGIDVDKVRDMAVEYEPTSAYQLGRDVVELPALTDDDKEIIRRRVKKEEDAPAVADPYQRERKPEPNLTRVSR